MADKKDMPKIQIITPDGRPLDNSQKGIISQILGEVYKMDLPSEEELEKELTEWGKPFRERLTIEGWSKPLQCHCEDYGTEHYHDPMNLFSVFLPINKAYDKGMFHKDMFHCVLKPNLPAEVFVTNEVKAIPCHNMEEFEMALAAADTVIKRWLDMDDNQGEA